MFVSVTLCALCFVRKAVRKCLLLDIIGVTLETLTNEAQHQPVSAAGYNWGQFLYLDASIVLRASRQTELCFAYKYHVEFQSASPGLVAQLGAR